MKLEQCNITIIPIHWNLSITHLQEARIFRQVSVNAGIWCLELGKTPNKLKLHSWINWKKVKSGNACHHSVQNLLSYSTQSQSVKIKIHRTIILPVVLYGRETWSLTLRQKCGLRVFEKSVEEDIWAQENEVTGEWRRLHIEKFYALYSS